MPPIGSVDLDALEEFLLSDRAPEDCMSLSDLDGFLTGIVVGPETIMPSEWLPKIWGGGEPEFTDLAEAQKIVGAIMGRYNEIVHVLMDAPERFDPIFWDGRDGQIIVSDWAAGCIDAMRLRPAAWAPLIKSPRAKILLIPMIVLGADDPDDLPFAQHPLSDDEVERVLNDGAEIVFECVIGIHAFWFEHRTPPVGGIQHERRAGRRGRR